MVLAAEPMPQKEFQAKLTERSPLVHGLTVKRSDKQWHCPVGHYR